MDLQHGYSVHVNSAVRHHCNIIEEDALLNLYIYIHFFVAYKKKILTEKKVNRS